MVPESSNANSVDLYRCRSFPDHWVREATLLEGRFVDTTVWRYHGRWWLLTTRVDPHPTAACLLLFSSSALTGEWRFHPANPISTDARTNRGAGRLFQTGDRLIRPSQSCCPIYGASLTFHEITELSTDRYIERPVKTVTPDFGNGLCGLHTYNQAGNIELIDAAQMMPFRVVS
jgi:hypothetical protein